MIIIYNFILTPKCGAISQSVAGRNSAFGSGSH